MNQFYTQDLNIIHDGTDVTRLEYGNLQTSNTSLNTGFGTYTSYIDGGNVKIDFYPNGTGTFEHQAQMTLFSGTGTTPGSTDLNVAKVKSSYVSIPSSGSPTAVGIATYSSPFSANYSVIVVKDTTNNELEMIEFGASNSSDNDVFTEFGHVYTSELSWTGWSYINGIQ